MPQCWQVHCHVHLPPASPLVFSIYLNFNLLSLATSLTVAVCWTVTFFLSPSVGYHALLSCIDFILLCVPGSDPQPCHLLIIMSNLQSLDEAKSHQGDELCSETLSAISLFFSLFITIRKKKKCFHILPRPTLRILETCVFNPLWYHLFQLTQVLIFPLFTLSFSLFLWDLSTLPSNMHRFPKLKGK